MKRTQIQFPDPLYERLKQVADMNDWPLAEVVRRATELYVQRFPEMQTSQTEKFCCLRIGSRRAVHVDAQSSSAETSA